MGQPWRGGEAVAKVCTRPKKNDGRVGEVMGEEQLRGLEGERDSEQGYRVREVVVGGDSGWSIGLGRRKDKDKDDARKG